MRKNHQPSCLIAWSPFTDQVSRIITELPLSSAGPDHRRWEDIEAMKTMVNQADWALEYLGKGYDLCIAHPITSQADATDKPLVIMETPFEIDDIIVTYPLIEGTFRPGIYEYDSELSHYVWLNNIFDLTQLVDQGPDDWGSAASCKIKCRSDSVVITDFEQDDGYTVPWHPKTFFDVFCPLCQHPVMIASVQIDDGNTCKPHEEPCAHYVGYTILSNGAIVEIDGFEEDVRYPFRFDGNTLSFQSPQGEWKQPIIWTSPEAYMYSAWGKLKDDTTQFFFLPSS